MFNFLAAVCAGATIGLVCSASALASTVTASAQVSSGLSYKADAAVANSNSAISSNGPLKLAVTNGDDLLAGTKVFIGTFNLTDAQIQANAANVAFLASNFVQYGSLAVGDGYSGMSGHFTSTIAGETAVSQLAGKQIFMFVVAATNNTSFANTISTAFQIGVFYDAMSTNSNWKFPAETDIPNRTSIDLADLTMDGTQLDAGGRVLIGGFGSDKSNATLANNFILASIPEPTTALATMLGGLALLARRPRRSSL